MRVYLPATLLDLDPTRLAVPATRRVHAVTAELHRALPEEDLEGLEAAAQLAAADDSLALLAGTAAAPTIRCVITAVVPDSVVDVLEQPGLAPSLVELRGGVRWDQVQCAHVDEPAAAADVAAALAGDEGAAERVGERDLLWYDVSELAELAAGRG